MAVEPPAESAVRRFFAVLFSGRVVRLFAFLMLPLGAFVSLAYLASREDPATTTGDPGTGDYLAFYTGAQLLASPRAADLYDLDLQAATQQQILGESTGYFQFYLNPPLLAWLLRWVHGWGYVPSFYAFDAAMFAAIAVGLLALLRAHRLSTPDRATTLALALCYAPMARTIPGGQNTPLTAALLAGIAAGLAGRGGWPVIGLCLGLLTFKPQFVILPSLVLLLMGQWRAVGLGALLGLAHYGIGALWVAPDWPLRMVVQIQRHRPNEVLHVGDQHFSLPTALPYWFGTPGAVVAPILAAAVALTVLGLAYRHRAHPRQTANVWGLTITGSMLCSPHLVYYDVGLLVVPVILLVFDVMAVRPLRLSEKFALTAAYLSYELHSSAKDLGFQPLTALLIGLFVMQLAWLVRLDPTSPSLLTTSDRS